MPQIEACFPQKGLISTWPDLYNVLKHSTKHEGESCSKMSEQFMGYIIHRAAVFQPNTVLFSRENEEITVSMAQEALDLMMSAIAKKNPVIRRYSVALKVLRAIQMRLMNGQPRKSSKNDLKDACEVLSEIQKENARTEEQKDRIDASASLCKLFIEVLIRD